MSEAVFRRESAVEYFKELVDDALARQRVNAGELTSFYVVHLLASFVRRPDRQQLTAVGRTTRSRSRLRLARGARVGRRAAADARFAKSAISPCSCPASFPIP